MNRIQVPPNTLARLGFEKVTVTCSCFKVTPVDPFMETIVALTFDLQATNQELKTRLL